MLFIFETFLVKKLYILHAFIDGMCLMVEWSTLCVTTDQLSKTATLEMYLTWLIKKHSFFKCLKNNLNRYKAGRIGILHFAVQPNIVWKWQTIDPIREKEEQKQEEGRGNLWKSYDRKWEQDRRKERERENKPFQGTV